MRSRVPDWLALALQFQSYLPKEVAEAFHAPPDAALVAL
jgi:hypothetical protein